MRSEHRRVSKMPSLLAIALLFVFLLLFGRKEISAFLDTPIFASFFGAVLGGCISVSIWLMTYIKDDRERHNRRKNFNKLVWIELSAFSLTVIGEARWWADRLQDKKVFATEERIFDHFQVAVISANLDRLTDLPSIVADKIIKLLALCRGLLTIGPMYFQMEDRLLQEHKINNLSESEAMEKISSNAKQLISLLVQLAAEAHEAAKLIDVTGEFRSEHKSSLWPAEAARQEKDEATLNHLIREFGYQ